jgi:hypothetical protein
MVYPFIHESEIKSADEAKYNESTYVSVGGSGGGDVDGLRAAYN